MEETTAIGAAPHLSLPFTGQVIIKQAFGHVLISEPLGYMYTDHSVSYFPPINIIGHDHYHNGIDYGLAFGVPLHAPANGFVAFAGWGVFGTQPVDTPGFGNCIILNHGSIYTLYGHLSEIDVHAGQQVARGQQIGKVGSTGNSDGPHLHWSVIRAGDTHYVDPAPFLAPPGPAITFVHFAVTAMNDEHPVGRFKNPTTQSPRLSNIAPGTHLQCDAWTYGERRWDAAANQFDARWYRLATGQGPNSGGWVASARCAGNAPNSRPLP